MLRKITNGVLVLAVVFSFYIIIIDNFGVEQAKAANAAVTITATQDKKFILNGDTKPITVTVNVKNPTAIIADHVRVDLPIDSSMTVSESSISNGGQFLGDKIVWLLPDMAAGSELNLTYQYRLDVVQTVQKYYVYVATNGSDTNAGTLVSPLKSISGARDMIRKYKDAHNNRLDKSFEVNILAGRYYFDAPVEFGDSTYHTDDSGTNDYPITYKAYGDGEVVFVGGGKVTSSWTQVPGKSYWKTNIGVSSWQPNNLIVNDVQATLAKDPNTGYYIADSFIDPTHPTAVLTAQPKKTMPDGSKVTISNCEYLSKAVDPESAPVNVGDTLSSTTKNLTNVRVHSYIRWTETTEPIKSINPQTGIIQTVPTTDTTNPNIYSCYTGGYPDKAGKIRYTLENVFEKLDAPGEWYFDSTNGDLFYYPRAGEDGKPENMDTAIVEASKIPTILTLSGVNHINIEGIKFIGTQTSYLANDATNRGALNEVGAINAVNSSNLKIIGNTFYGTGDGGVNIVSWPGASNHVLIQKNTFDSIGVTPLYMNGSMDTSQVITPNYSAIIDNIFINSGTVKTTQVIHIFNVSGTLVENNDIDTAGYIGIRGSYNNTDQKGSVIPNVTFASNLPQTVISKNRIKNVMQKLNDGAGIYSYHARNIPVSIDNNIVSDIVATAFHYDLKKDSFGGLYLDVGQSNTSITNNLVYNVDMGLDTDMSGVNNRVVNNIFAKIINLGFHSSYITPAEYKNGSDGTTAQNESQKLLLKNNIVQFENSATDTIRFMMARQMIRYSDLNLFYPKTSTDTNTNIAAGAWNQYYKASVAGELRVDVEPDSIPADPLFVDPANNNFSLQPTSPAFGLGFKAIDLTKVGTDW
jgi:hypothetical protein